MWLLITAGHVIDGIKGAVSAGYDLFAFQLHDVSAGHQFESSVPIAFEAAEWIVFHDDSEGMDYAAWPIHHLYVRQLDAGGVIPLSEKTWGTPPLEQYSPWVLVGTPRESTSAKGNRVRINLVALILEQVDAPADAKITRGRTFAKIRAAPGDKARVYDVDGMSGGPIFGILTKDNSFSYWVIGVQSSWLPSPRIVSFCATSSFFSALKEAIEHSRAIPNDLSN